MRTIYLDEKNVGRVISWFKNIMPKQYKLHKLQYDRNTKKWVLTLENVYPSGKDKEQLSMRSEQNENFKLTI